MTAEKSEPEKDKKPALHDRQDPSDHTQNQTTDPQNPLCKHTQLCQPALQNHSVAAAVIDPLQSNRASPLRTVPPVSGKATVSGIPPAGSNV